MTPGVGKAVNKFLENRRKFDERQKINKIRDFHSTGCLLPDDHGLYFGKGFVCLLSSLISYVKMHPLIVA